jgi:hypothetical protein
VPDLLRQSGSRVVVMLDGFLVRVLDWEGQTGCHSTIGSDLVAGNPTLGV